MPRASDNPVLDRLTRPLLYAYFRMMHGLRWEGAENVPREGPAILASNHQN
jgi:1-acyl-sn-glycerol-3-phosphate acyltransferase